MYIAFSVAWLFTFLFVLFVTIGISRRPSSRCSTLQAASSQAIYNLCDSAKLYDPGYSTAVCQGHNSAEEEKVDGWELTYRRNYFRYKISIAEFTIWCQVVSFSPIDSINFKTLDF